MDQEDEYEQLDTYSSASDADEEEPIVREKRPRQQKEWVFLQFYFIFSEFLFFE
mgnify:CR=1 FL=1